MSDFRSIHHINFLVRDLDNSIKKYQEVLGLGPFDREELSERGVVTAKTPIGDSWLVLVMPTDMNSIPGKHLQQNGEGFFLLSFGVNNLQSSLEKLAEPLSTGTKIRKGVDDWSVADLDTLSVLGVQFHLTEVGGSLTK